MVRAMSESADVDEIIPPPTKGGSRLTSPGVNKRERHATARIIARWLDELFRIPGTSYHVGLDPIISLIPGVGDIISSSISFVVMLEAVRIGVPVVVIAHMAFNVVVNALLDMIPGVGPVASVFFKSNSRNLNLLIQWREGSWRKVHRGSRLLLTAILTGSFGVLIVLVCVWVFYAYQLARWLGWV